MDLGAPSRGRLRGPQRVGAGGYPSRASAPLALPWAPDPDHQPAPRLPPPPPPAIGFQDTGQPTQIDEDQWALVPRSAQVSTEALTRWRAKVEALGEEQLLVFAKEMPTGELQGYASAIEKLIVDKAKASKTLKVANWIDPLVRVVGMCQPLAAGLDSLYPPAGLILGGVHMVLSLGRKAADYQEAMVGFLQRMMGVLQVVDKFKSDFPLTPDVQLALIDIYGDILKFCVQASKPFLDHKGKPRSSVALFVKSTFTSFEKKFGEVEESLKTHLEDFDRVVTLALGQMSKHLQQTQMMSLWGQAQAIDMLRASDSRRRQEYEERRGWEMVEWQTSMRSQLLGWISTVSFQETQDEKAEETLPGTGKWFLDHPLFEAWKAQKGGLLRVYGKQGSGKSHIASCVIQDLETLCHSLNESSREGLLSSQRSGLAYVYCSSRWAYETEQRPDSPGLYARKSAAFTRLLRSILRQLYQELPVGEDVESLRDRYFKRAHDGLSRDNVRDGIRAAIGKLSRTFIVIDGLDQCRSLDSHGFRSLCSFIASLVQTGPEADPANVIILSRPGYELIDKELDGSPKIVVDGGANTSDINRFIREKTVDLSKNEHTLRDIREFLQEQANGMFLWVSLVVDALRGERTDRNKLKALRTMPKDLEGAYGMSIERILAQSSGVRDTALMALIWLANSPRPLSKTELLEALSIEPDTRTRPEPDWPEDDSWLVTDCADLLVLKADGRCELVHPSLKEYLTAILPTSRPLKLKAMWELQSEADDLLAVRCLTYLMLDTFKAPCPTYLEFETMSKDMPLFRYAVLNWGRHCSRAVDSNSEIRKLACKYLREEKLRNLSVQAILEYMALGHSFPYAGDSTPLHLISFFGIGWLSEFLTTDELETDCPDALGNYPWDLSAAGRRKAMTMWLLDRHESFNGGEDVKSKHSLMCLAAASNWPAVISKLCSLGRSPDEKNLDSDAALHVAAREGRLEATEALLAAGADVNILNGQGDTPLLIAAQNSSSRSSLMELFIKSGADVSVKGGHGSTALHLVAQEDDGEMIARLLAAGADVNAWSGYFGSSLHVAARSGSAKAIKALCKAGADTELLISPMRYTPLIVAAQALHTEAVQVLLEYKASVHRQDLYGWTMLHHMIFFSSQRPVPNLFSTALARKDVRGLLGTPDSTGGRLPVHIALSIPGISLADIKIFLDAHERDNIPLDTPTFSILRGSIQYDRLDVTRELIDHHRLDPRQTGPGSVTLLHDTAYWGRPGHISTLLSYGLDPNAESEDFYSTPLLLATVSNHPEVARVLATEVEGVKVFQANSGKMTALDFAALHGFGHLVELFLSCPGAQDALNNYDRRSPHHFAVMNGRLQGIELLCHADNVNEPTRDSQDTPLMLAATYGHFVAAKLLLEMGAHINAVSTIKRVSVTALIAATAKGRTSLAGMLLDRGADADLAGADGVTALHIAASQGNTVLVTRLLDAGCRVSPEDIDGYTPLVSAVRGSQSRTVEIFALRGLLRGGDWALLDLLEMAAKRGDEETFAILAPLSEEGDIGKSLYFAAKHGRMEMVKSLLRGSYATDDTDSPVVAAALNGHPETVEILARAGKPVDDPDENGLTPLHIAVRRRSRKMLKALLAAGATQMKDDLGMWPRDYAGWCQSTKSMLMQVGLIGTAGFSNRLPSSGRISRLATKLKSALRPRDGEEADMKEAQLMLGDALIRHDNLADAVACLSGLFHGSRMSIACGSCDRLIEKQWFVCNRCSTAAIICGACFFLYKDHGSQLPLQLPSLSTAAELTKQALKIRALLRSVSLHGAGTLYRVLCQHPVFISWVYYFNRKYLDAEDAVESETENAQYLSAYYTATGRLTSIMIDLLRGFRPEVTNIDPAHEPMFDPWVFLTEELRDLFQWEPIDYEPVSLGCGGHTYHAIPHFSDLSPDWRRYFDEDSGAVKATFFDMLADKYCPAGTTIPHSDSESDSERDASSDEDEPSKSHGPDEKSVAEASPLNARDPPLSVFEFLTESYHDRAKQASVTKTSRNPSSNQDRAERAADQGACRDPGPSQDQAGRAAHGAPNRDPSSNDDGSRGPPSLEDIFHDESGALGWSSGLVAEVRSGLLSALGRAQKSTFKIANLFAPRWTQSQYQTEVLVLETAWRLLQEITHIPVQPPLGELIVDQSKYRLKDRDEDGRHWRRSRRSGPPVPWGVGLGSHGYGNSPFPPYQHLNGGMTGNVVPSPPSPPPPPPPPRPQPSLPTYASRPPPALLRIQGKGKEPQRRGRPFRRVDDASAFECGTGDGDGFLGDAIDRGATPGKMPEPPTVGSADLPILMIRPIERQRRPY